MLGDTRARGRARRLLGPWLLAGLALWLVFDNAPALIEEWRLRGSVATDTATVVSIGGGRPVQVTRRLWDDVFWGRGRRVTYQIASRDGEPRETAFVTHAAADALQQGGPVRVRYLSADPSVHRIDGEPGLLTLLFRLVIALALLMLGVVLLRGGHSRSETQLATPRMSA